MRMKFWLKKLYIPLIFATVLAAAGLQSSACTSALVGAERGKDGRWILWKHRDSGHPDNYVRSFPRTDSALAYVALFNAEDVEAREAWIGFNEAGFAVMNTATYNIPAPRKGWEDREGLVMTDALRTCRSLVDFYQLLTQMPLPRGVQANFGAFDAEGHGAYFETDDYGCIVFPLDSVSARHLGVSLNPMAENATHPNQPATPDVPDPESLQIDGMLTRTNFSISGGKQKRLGYSRYLAENHLIDSIIQTQRPWAPVGRLASEDLLETLSRSLWLPSPLPSSPSSLSPSIAGIDLLTGGSHVAPDNGDVISRRSSCASVAIEGPLPGEDPAATMIMWTAIGFPTLSVVEPVTIDSVPSSLQGNLHPNSHKLHSALCDSVNSLRAKAFRPNSKGAKSKYNFNLDYLRREIPLRRAKSILRYSPAREDRKTKKNNQ